MLAAPMALASPPPHAVASGYHWHPRAASPRYAARYHDRGYVVRHGGCGDDGVGTLLGAVTGGVIGSAVGQGENRAAAIFTGALLGGIIGHQVSDDGRCYDGYRTRAYAYAPGPGVAYVPNPVPVYAYPRVRPAYVVPVPRPGYVYPVPRRAVPVQGPYHFHRVAPPARRPANVQHRAWDRQHDGRNRDQRYNRRDREDRWRD
jgi:hypothetical protein